MFTLEEIQKMTPEELKENWTEVAISSMKLLGAIEMNDEDLNKIAKSQTEES
jgi:hypothetical protein